MAQDKLPTGKIERASKFLQTGAKVGTNYLKHFGKKVFYGEADRNELDRANAQDIFEGFAELRGSALKVAQMLSLDSVNLSESFTSVMQKAQYSVPPMSAPLAVQAFAKSMGKTPDKVFDVFDSQAHKAASMGQVHIAYKDGKKLAVKIQYPGVAESIKSDLKMVLSVAPRIVKTTTAELKPYFNEIEERLLEEADYRLELKKSVDFKKLCEPVPGIVFPEYFPEFSGDRVITMGWLDGFHLKEFLEQKPPKQILQKAAENLWRFYEYQIHVLRQINADPHPGNFLFRMDGTVGVLDFGCTKILSEEVYNNYFLLAEPNLFSDKHKAREVLLKLELLRPTDAPERADYIQGLFERLITLICQPYHIGRFNFNNPEFYEQINEIGQEISNLRELRGSKDFLFINRTYFGLYALFQQLDAEIDTACQYRDFLKK